MEKELIHIVLSVYDPFGDYSRHAAVTMVSICENTKSNIKFHILHDETLSNESRKKFFYLGRKYKKDIEFYYIDLDRSVLDLESLKRVSRGTLFRLYMDEVLDIEKCIYLDTDIVVTIDIKILWKEFEKNILIGAVKESKKFIENMKNEKFYNNINFGSKYFNAGVIIIDLLKCKKIFSISKETINFLNIHPEAPFSDQDALNFLFKNKVYFLDPKYNVIPFLLFYENGYQKDKIEKNCIWHFAGWAKPWKAINTPIDILYWRYLILTPWCEKKEEIIEFMVEMNNKDFPLDLLISHQIMGNRKRFFKELLKRIIKEGKKFLN